MAAEDRRRSQPVAADSPAPYATRRTTAADFPALNGPIWQGLADMEAEDRPSVPVRATMAYVTLGPEQVKRDLWKAVTDGNVEDLRVLQGLPVVTIAAIGTNSRTGWTIVHEAVERGHSGTMLTMTVQMMGSDSVNKKTRTGLTPAHVAASKRDTLALMALANLGADLSVLAADRVQLRELQKQASEEPPEPLEQARLMLATLDPSALTQPNLDTMQIDLATTKTTLETASERVQREVMRRELPVPRAEEQTCAICLDRPPNVTFVPCGHKMTCEQCAARVTECPSCRRPIQLRQRTFG